MTLSISYKTFHNGKKFAYIVDNSWDSVTKRLTTRTLECLGLQKDSHKERDKVTKRFKQYRSDPSLYKQAADGSIRNEVADNCSGSIPSFSLAMAPYLKLWKMLGLG